MFYIVDPDITDAEGPLAASFLDAARDSLRFQPSVDLDTNNIAAASREIGPSDGVVFFNPPSGTPLPTDVHRFFERSVTAGATLLPVALDPSREVPPSPFDLPQSFSVDDFQRVRSHPVDYVLPAAQRFVREALFQVAPSCYPVSLRLFLVHKRSDGADIARELHTRLRRGREIVFRYVDSVVVGDDAQARIEDELQQVDGIVFLDTPDIGDSHYAMLELRTAIARRVPIVWVRCMHDVTDRTDLPVLPTAEPHFLVRSGAIDYDGLAEEIVNCVFELSHGIVASALESMSALEDYAPTRGIDVAPLDRRLFIYRVEGRRGPSGYPDRPSVDICQFFGRRPTDEDERALRLWAADQGLIDGDGDDDRGIDHAALLDPRPTKRVVTDWVVREHADDYLESLVGDRREGPTSRPLLMITGSFQESAEMHPEVLRAVADIAHEWMSRGGGIVMGGHPTFTPLVTGAAHDIDPVHPQRLLTVYQSEFFVDRGQAEALEHYATVVLTRTQGERERSLTLMRRRMFEHEELVGMVVIGGRTDSGGIDEEVELAQPLRIPIVPLASVGGRTAELFNEIDARDAGWSSFTVTPISGPDLRAFSLRTDYRGIARDLFAVLASG